MANYALNYHSLLVSFLFVVHFMHPPCSIYLGIYVSLHIATLAQSTVSTMAAGDASQATSVQNTHVFNSCCVVLHRLHVGNFDSCKSLTCYMVCIN